MKANRLSRRDFLRIGAFTTAGAVLASCASAPQPAVAPAAPTTAPQSQPKTVTQAPAAAAGTVVFWWHHGGDVGKSVEAANAKFMQDNANIKIEGLQISDLGTKVNTALAGGAGPDVWDSDSGTLSYAIKGALHELDSYLAISKIQVDDFPQKPAMVWKGKTYAIPAIESGMENALVWNKKIFKEAGLDPEKPPTTLAELEATAKKLTKLDAAGNIQQLGFDTRDSSAGMFPNWLSAQGVAYYDANAQKITFTQPEAIAFVDWLVAYEKAFDPAKVGAFNKTFPRWGSVTPGGAFCAGKEAMMVDGSWCPGGLAKLAADGDFGYTWVPSMDGKVKGQQMGAHQLGLNAKSKVADAAWKLIEFHGTAGNDMIYNASGSFAYSKTFAAKVDTSPWKGLQWYFDSVAQATYNQPRGSCPNAGDAWNKWWAAVDDLVFGRATSSKDALAKAEQEAQKLLDDLVSS